MSARRRDRARGDREVQRRVADHIHGDDVGRRQVILLILRAEGVECIGCRSRPVHEISRGNRVEDIQARGSSIHGEVHVRRIRVHARHARRRVTEKVVRRCADGHDVEARVPPQDFRDLMQRDADEVVFADYLPVRGIVSVGIAGAEIDRAVRSCVTRSAQAQRLCLRRGQGPSAGRVGVGGREIGNAAEIRRTHGACCERGLHLRVGRVLEDRAACPERPGAGAHAERDVDRHRVGEGVLILLLRVDDRILERRDIGRREVGVDARIPRVVECERIPRDRCSKEDNHEDCRALEKGVHESVLLGHPSPGFGGTQVRGCSDSSLHFIRRRKPPHARRRRKSDEAISRR